MSAFFTCRFKSLRASHVLALLKNPKGKPRHERVDIDLYTKSKEEDYIDVKKEPIRVHSLVLVCVFVWGLHDFCQNSWITRLSLGPFIVCQWGCDTDRTQKRHPWFRFQMHSIHQCIILILFFRVWKPTSWYDLDQKADWKKLQKSFQVSFVVCQVAEIMCSGIMIYDIYILYIYGDVLAWKLLEILETATSRNIPAPEGS